MRETVDPEFAAYVDARQERWLRSAYLVYGDPERAAELLLQAFTRLSLRWGRVDDPDVFVQRILYGPAMSRWARPGPAEPTDEPTRAALDRLTSAQRAMLVLVYFEELTEFEASDILGMSRGVVHNQVRVALSKFGEALATGDQRDVSPGERR